jgi:hypothetical protein
MQKVEKQERRPSKSFRPVKSRFDSKKVGEEKSSLSPRQASAKAPNTTARRILGTSIYSCSFCFLIDFSSGVGKDFNGDILQKFPHLWSSLRSGDLLIEVNVYVPVIRARFPPIDAYKSQFGDYYAIPLGSAPMLAFLDFVYADKISVGSITDPEDIIDLIRFCGMHMPRFRSELLSHFLEHVKVENCIKYLTIAYELSRDPASSREISRALNYLKFFFVSNWDRVTMTIDMEVIPHELLIELIRVNSKGNGKVLNDLKTYETYTSEVYCGLYL